jgi:hypothetical protein
MLIEEGISILKKFDFEVYGEHRDNVLYVNKKAEIGVRVTFGYISKKIMSLEFFEPSGNIIDKTAVDFGSTKDYFEDLIIKKLYGKKMTKLELFYDLYMDMV